MNFNPNGESAVSMDLDLRLISVRQTGIANRLLSAVHIASDTWTR